MAAGQGLRSARPRLRSGDILAGLDAVTIDAYGTLLELCDPVPALVGALARHGAPRDAAAVERALAAEGRHYRAIAERARDAASLDGVRRECAAVFLEAVGADLDAADFAGEFVAALVFEPIAGARETVELLRRRGLRLAVVANWDFGLHEHLARTGLAALFDAVVVSAEVGARKPHPLPFRVALERLGAAPGRSLHVGDDAVDDAGARAAGMRFAWAPLETLCSRRA